MNIEKTAVLPVGPDEAFALITEPERLRRWQTVSARVDLRAGGEYRWTVVPGHHAAGTFHEVEAGRRVVFGWGWEGSDGLPPDASVVTVTLEPTAGGTLVRLVHEGLPEAQVPGHTEGWEHFMTRLERAATVGDAGPDEWASTPDPMTRLSAADATLAVCQQVLRGLVDSDLDKPTPSAGYSVGQMVDHLVESLGGLAVMGGGYVEVSDGGTSEDRVADAAQQALELWNRRGLDGTVKAGSNEMPAELAADIFSIELLVHGWDVARATGRELVVSDALAGYVLELAREFIVPAVRAGGSFGPEVEVPSDASVLERLIAFSGRRFAA
jgi:uncharacterized protein (TIGR03086 family)